MLLNFLRDNPNLFLRAELIENRDYTVTENAKMLRLIRVNISNTLTEKTMISPNMACVLQQFLMFRQHFCWVCKMNIFYKTSLLCLILKN